jgi:tRNA A-37 threonylcarbamoyl transferase component Bud32
MSCLGDSTILRFISGQLDDAARAHVENEVGSCRACAALVAELLRSGVGLRAPDADDATDAEDPIGDAAPGVRSRYLLGPVIARGGMGTVLAAFDRRLNRSVAIKTLDGAAPLLAARFEREIRVTASLQHPGIVPIYDAGVLPEGRPFYAMRHVPGASLEQAIRDSRDARQHGLVVSVLAAAGAVAYAHERGITHRDLKPANILVGPFGETVVIDWGLAGIEEDAADELGRSSDPATTCQGSVFGTPRYMAPEQARGEPATYRSDVYALGAILYHTLSGMPPVAGDDVTGVLERVARAEVRPLRDVAPALPADLVAIVERAMAPDPAARYASAGELAADLRRFHTGQLVAAHRYSRGDLVRRFVRRQRAAVVFAALLVAVLTVGATLGVRGMVREREHAEAERGRKDVECYRASSICELAAQRGRRGDRRSALAAGQGAQAMLRSLAERVALEPDETKKRREIAAASGTSASATASASRSRP